MRRKKPEGEAEAAGPAPPSPWLGRAWVCGGSMPRAARCLGELAFAPSSLAQPDPAPGPAPSSSSLEKGHPSPQTQSAPRAWAPQAINHKWRYWGSLGAFPGGFPGVSGAREQFLSVPTPQTGSKQHERNQRENVVGKEPDF